MLVFRTLIQQNDAHKGACGTMYDELFLPGYV